MIKSIAEILADVLETNAFIQYHNFVLGCGDAWLYKYAVTLGVRSELKKPPEIPSAIEDVLPLLCGIADRILGYLEGYDVFLSEAGRKNPALYEDNMIRWSIEFELDKRRQEFIMEIDHNDELKAEIKNRITLDCRRVYDEPEAAAKGVEEFWDPENLKSYSIQIGDELVYSRARWREENKYRL